MNSSNALLLVYLGASLAFGNGSGLAGPEETQPVDYSQFPKVVSPDNPRETQQLSLKEVWRLDCDESDVLIGRIEKAVCSTAGRTLLLDKQLNQVLVIGPEGAIERVVCREGEGPGETEAAHDLLLLPDGTIGVMEGASPLTFAFGGAGRVLLFDAGGDPTGTWNPAREDIAGEFPTLRGVRQAGGLTLVGLNLNKVSPPEMTMISRLVICDDAGEINRVIAEYSFTDLLTGKMIRERNIFEPYTERRFDISSGGRIAYAPERDRYLVVVLDPGGDGFRLETPWEPCLRDPAVVREMEEQQSSGPFEYEACPADPAIQQVIWRPDGGLWVESCRSDDDLSAEAFCCFDEYDAAGKWLGVVELIVPGDPGTDRLLVLANGRFVLVRNLLTPEDGAGDAGAESDLGYSVSLLEPGAG